MTRQSWLPGLVVSLGSLLITQEPALAQSGTTRFPIRFFDELTEPVPKKPGLPRANLGEATLESGAASWRLWWSLNWDRLIDLRGRLALNGKREEPNSRWKPINAEVRRGTILPVLLETLGDRDARVREASAIALGKLGLPEVVTPLTKSLRKDKNLAVRNAAALALGLSRQIDAEEVLLNTFRSKRTKELTRGWAAVGLGYLSTQKGSEALLEALSALSRKSGPKLPRETLVCCAAGLSVSQRPKTAPAIRELIAKSRDKAHDVRALLLVALGKLGDPGSLEIVTKNLRHKAAITRTGAASAAALIGTAENLELVEELIRVSNDDPDEMVRSITRLSLGYLGSPHGRLALRRQLTTTHDLGDLRIFTGLALGLSGDDDDTGTLALFLRSSYLRQRGPFALAIGLLGHPHAGPVIAKSLEETRNPAVFADTAIAAGLLEADRREFLRDLVRVERRPEFRVPAGIALGLMGDLSTSDLTTERMAKSKSQSDQFSHALLTAFFLDQRNVEAVGRVALDSRVSDPIRVLCCVGLGNVADPNRYPILSDLAHHHPWLVRSTALDAMLTLF